MIIVPTRVCNTDSCWYCGVLKKDFSVKYFQDFDVNDFYSKLKVLANTSWDHTLRFFWWEPFLKFGVIKKIISSPLLRKERARGWSFVINTNLSLIKDEYLEFLKQYNVKLIISCNGDLYSHSTTRNIDKQKVYTLYDNIKKVIQNNIPYQINIVTTPDIVGRLHKNFTFIYSKLWWKIFNLLPVNYNGWTQEWLEELKRQFLLIEKDIKLGKLPITFINKDVNNEVSLFNSEIVIDSDGKVYPSMVILEKFFEKEKNKIVLSDCNKSSAHFKEDIDYYEEDNHKIYDSYINKVLHKKFENIIENDNMSSKLFHDFLNRI